MIPSNVKVGAKRKYAMPFSVYHSQISEIIENGGLSITTHPFG
jgi:hypothetical protein